MAGKTAILSLKIIGDATSAQKAAADTEKAVSGMEKAAGAASKGMQLAGAAAGGALILGLNQAIENDTSTRQLAASMGLDPAEQETAGRIAGDVYSGAYGESMQQVNDTIAGVASTLADLSANGGADVERLTKKALDLATAFPEVGDGVATAGILMKTGLAKSADEAYDLMAGSLQKVPKAMQAELFPVMDEYSKHFADLGIDGTTAFGIMSQAAEGGAIQMDKTGDALKEFTIRATDGSKATADAYKSIGLDAEDMARKIAAGGPSAQEAFAKTVAGLQSIEDPAAQAQAAIGLFGTPLEDLGTAKIPDFLGAIDPMGDSFDSLAGKADELGTTLNSGPGVALETLKRTAMDSFTQIAASALPVLEPIIAILMQYAPVLGPIAVAFAAIAAIIWIVNGAMMAWNAALLIGKAAVAISTAAQWAWNAAMSANPIGVIILLIAGLVAGVIWAYENVGWFRDAVDTAGRVAGEVFQNIVTWVGDVIKWLDDLLGPVGGIEGALAIMGTAGKIALDGIIGGIQSAIGWVQDAIGWFNSLFGAKDKAASVDVGGADSGGFGLALASPAYNAGSFGAGPEAGSFAASYSSTASSMSGAVSSGSDGPAVVNISIEVKADATTDGVQLGRSLVKAINKALTAQGSPKLATV